MQLHDTDARNAPPSPSESERLANLFGPRHPRNFEWLLEKPYLINEMPLDGVARAAIDCFGQKLNCPTSERGCCTTADNLGVIETVKIATGPQYPQRLPPRRHLCLPSGLKLFAFLLGMMPLRTIEPIGSRQPRALLLQGPSDPELPSTVPWGHPRSPTNSPAALRILTASLIERCDAKLVAPDASLPHSHLPWLDRAKANTPPYK